MKEKTTTKDIKTRAISILQSGKICSDGCKHKYTHTRGKIAMSSFLFFFPLFFF